jgi:hypothetical protein
MSPDGLCWMMYWQQNVKKMEEDIKIMVLCMQIHPVYNNVDNKMFIKVMIIRSAETNVLPK